MNALWDVRLWGYVIDTGRMFALENIARIIAHKQYILSLQ